MKGVLTIYLANMDEVHNLLILAKEKMFSHFHIGRFCMIEHHASGKEY